MKKTRDLDDDADGEILNLEREGGFNSDSHQN